jgi:type IV secretory pathway TrbD component
MSDHDYQREYAIPFLYGMVEKRLLGGVPKTLWVLLITINGVLVFGYQQFAFLFASILLFGVVRKLYSIDVDFYDVYQRSKAHNQTYQP